jgi:uncharacterized protein (UPF0303 family)
MMVEQLSNEPMTMVELAAHEEELRFQRFDYDDSWALGGALVAEARRLHAPVVIDISRAGQQLFHAALPGTAVDNDRWIARKSRVVLRFGHSSLYMGQLCREQNTSLEEKFGLPPRRYAAHGGAFPLTIKDVGVVGVIAVSGLPQLQDHRLVIAVLAAHLGTG